MTNDLNICRCTIIHILDWVYILWIIYFIYYIYTKNQYSFQWFKNDDKIIQRKKDGMSYVMLNHKITSKICTVCFIEFGVDSTVISIIGHQWWWTLMGVHKVNFTVYISWYILHLGTEMATQLLERERESERERVGRERERTKKSDW